MLFVHRMLSQISLNIISAHFLIVLLTYHSLGGMPLREQPLLPI